VGPSLTYSVRDVPVAGGGVRSDERTDFGVVGGLGLSYSGRLTSVSAGFNQTVDQDSNGEVESRSSLTASISHQLTETSSIGVSTQLLAQTPLFGADDERQTFSLTPTYRLSLTEDWTLTTGYRLRASNDDDFDLSNLVFVQISRGFDFLP
jgi:hypothetical protein